MSRVDKWGKAAGHGRSSDSNLLAIKKSSRQHKKQQQQQAALLGQANSNYSYAHVFIIYTGNSQKETEREGERGEGGSTTDSYTVPRINYTNYYKACLWLRLGLRLLLAVPLLLPLLLTVVACLLHARVMPDPVKARVMCRQIAYLDCS